MTGFTFPNSTAWWMPPGPEDLIAPKHSTDSNLEKPIQWGVEIGKH